MDIEVGIIFHRKGFTLFAGMNEDEIADQVYAYCREHWADWHRYRTPPPEITEYGIGEVIASYFADTQGEERWDGSTVALVGFAGDATPEAEAPA